ncbi:MAG: orotidine 5'-phosphate decarboxylase / HUMPS family protein [Alphaproteobacteria bacterium]|jgi:3-hexulose-6-phosphate synthase|nr:orotidine 5'-phosphate decarboxylase [Candidatus Jidaibacter sp.]
MSKNSLLQLEVDILDITKVMSVLEKTSEFVDIIEIGSTLIKCEGINLLRILKSKFDKIPIFVDIRTIDDGEYDTKPFLQNGAAYVTVLGESDNKTIESALKVAREYKGKVVVDLMAVQDKVSRIRELKAIDVEFFYIHNGFEQQAAGKNYIAECKEIVSNFHDLKLFVAGSSSPSVIQDIMTLSPYAIVVGGEVISATDPRGVAKSINDTMLSFLDKKAV